MSNDLDKLQAAIRLSQRGKLGKLLCSPARMGPARVLEVYCRAARTAVRRRTRTFWGEAFTVVLPEPMSVRINRYGYFEEELTRALLEFVKPGMVFFDVGSHFGYFSLLAAHLVGPGGQVHAFEPTRSTFGVLSENLGGRSNVRLNNVAAYREEGELTFKDFGLRDSMFNSIHGARTTEAYRATIAAPTEVRVEAVRLDTYVAKSGSVPHFVKMDAEGAEPDVLAGFRDTMARHRPMLSLEVGDWGVAGMQPSREVVESVLAAGYRALEYRAEDGGRFVAHRVKERYGYDNLLFVPA